jgi:hypothetical protein
MEGDIMRIVLLVFCLSFVLVSLNATLNPAQQISDIPLASRFAGNEAIVYHDGVLYLVYLKNQTNQASRNLIFAKSTDQGVSFSSQIVTTVHDYGICHTDALGNFTTVDESSPTIEVTNEHIIITFHDLGKMYTAISSDGGNQFVITQFDMGYDPLPLVREMNGVLHSYIASKDPAGDILYTAFYDKYETENVDFGVEAGRSYFYGADVVYGAVRSNTDIWVEQMGGGTNNGWPTFWGPVYTSGIIQCSTGTPPYESIFRAGYYEHVAPMNYGVDTTILESGPVFPVAYDPTDNTICLVRVTGSAYTSWIGHIIEQPDPYQLDVYVDYPPPSGSVLATNTVAHRDTIWTEGPSGSVNNSTMNVRNRLWIEGTFSGKQTWYSGHDIKIIGDIKLNETPMGINPDGGTTPQNANLHDYVALVSEGKVIVGYGYKSPIDSLRHYSTIGSDGFGANTGVWIYASLFALGNGDGNPHNDGVFTFEYQHPHPSTPAIHIGDVLYDMNDLHEHIFPPTTTDPWPGNLDYPWYNPLWPENMTQGKPYLERGYIHRYGPIYQVRAGFLHRSVNDPPNHNGTWNFANYKYGSQCTGINYPGASGAGVGYKKDVHADTRITDKTFPFNINGNGIRLGISSDLQIWNTSSLLSAEKVFSKTMQIVNNHQQVLTLNNHIYTITENGFLPFTTTPAISGNIRRSFANQTSINMLADINKISEDSDTLQIVTVNQANGTTNIQLTVPTSGKIFDFLCNDDNHCMLANADQEGIISFYKQDDASQYVLAETWNPGLASEFLTANREESRMVLIPTTEDSMYVLFYIKPISGTSNGTFYLAKGHMTMTGNQEDVAQPFAVEMNTYPNPFTNEMKIHIRNNKFESAWLEVYNLRGQLIKTISTKELLSKEEYTLSWNGTDNRGHAVASGIYFLKAVIGDKTLTCKILRIK